MNRCPRWAFLLALLRHAWVRALYRWARVWTLARWARVMAFGCAHWWWLAGLLALLMLRRHLSGVLISERKYMTVFTTRNSYSENSKIMWNYSR